MWFVFRICGLRRGTHSDMVGAICGWCFFAVGSAVLGFWPSFDGSGDVQHTCGAAVRDPVSFGLLYF